MYREKALPKAPKIKSKANVSTKTLDIQTTQCTLVNNLIGFLKCETQPILPQLCTSLLDFRAKNCGGTPPVDPCAGVTCPIGSTCNAGTCVPDTTCKPNGELCNIDSDCCSTFCNGGICSPL